MKQNHQPLTSSSVDLVHETNYAIEVLQKEFPKFSADKIARALNKAREAAGPSADRWQILAHARATLSR